MKRGERSERGRLQAGDGGRAFPAALLRRGSHDRMRFRDRASGGPVFLNSTIGPC